MFVKNYSSVLYHIIWESSNLSMSLGFGLAASLHGLQQLQPEQPAEPVHPKQEQDSIPGPQRSPRLGDMSWNTPSAPPWTVTERVIQRPRPLPTHRRGQVCICVCCAHVLRFCETSGGCCYCYTLVNRRAPYKAVTADIIFLRLWWVGDTDHWVSFAHHLPPPIRTGSEKL